VQWWRDLRPEFPISYKIMNMTILRVDVRDVAMARGLELSEDERLAKPGHLRD